MQTTIKAKFRINPYADSVSVKQSTTDHYGREVNGFMDIYGKWESYPKKHFELSYRLKTYENDAMARWVSDSSNYLYKRVGEYAEKLVTRWVKKGIGEKVNKGMMYSAYPFMRAESIKTGYPKNYQRDLSHHDALFLGLVPVCNIGYCVELSLYVLVCALLICHPYPSDLS